MPRQRVVIKMRNNKRFVNNHHACLVKNARYASRLQVVLKLFFYIFGTHGLQIET